MSKQLESALLTTDDSEAQHGNNIKEFNQYCVYLDGNPSILTLGAELQKASSAESQSLKLRAISVILLSISLLGCILGILLIEVLESESAGIVITVIAVILTIISGYFCFKNFNKSPSAAYFSSEWRDGLRFDKATRQIKQILFKPDYGLDMNAGQDMKYANVHDPIIEEKTNNIICSFDEVTDIGEIIQRNDKRDVIGYQFYIGYANKTEDDKKWTANMIPGSNGAQRYHSLKKVMKNVDPKWFQSIEVNDYA